MGKAKLNIRNVKEYMTEEGFLGISFNVTMSCNIAYLKTFPKDTLNHLLNSAIENEEYENAEIIKRILKKK